MRRMVSTSLHDFFSSPEEQGFLGVIYLELLYLGVSTSFYASFDIDLFSLRASLTWRSASTVLLSSYRVDTVRGGQYVVLAF